METKWFEFQFGIYVEAHTDEDAFRIISPLLKQAESLDTEGDVPCELVNTWPVGGPPSGSNFKGQS